jgi:hypothetical protein
MAGWAELGGQGGEQVLDLRDGQRNHARIWRWWLTGETTS